MKKIFVLLVSLLTVMGVSAQEESTSAKRTVAVDGLSYNSNIGTNWVTDLRNQIIGGLAQTGRLEIVDVESIADLPSGDAEKLAHLKGINVESLIKCHFNSLNTKRETSDGKTSYTVKINFTLTILNAETGATLNTKTIEDSGRSSESETAAINAAMKNVQYSISTFVDENFKMVGVVKALEEMHPKKGVETLYITVGSNAGLKEGQHFLIYVETDLAGEVIKKEVKGHLSIKQVVNPNLSLAVVRGKEAKMAILKAFDNEQKVIVESCPPVLLGGLL